MRKISWGYLALLNSLLIFGCTNDFQVEHYGALRKVMKENNLSTHVDFSKIKQTKNLYALGALAELKGEVIVLDGVPFVFRAVEDSFVVENTFDFALAFGVTAYVKKWKDCQIPDDVRSWNDLENHLLKEAKASGINVEKPFPFIVEGLISSISWHIVNWPEGDEEHTHDKHVKSGPNGTNIFESVQMLGFYSDKHHGIFTHHSHNMHLHFVKKDGKLGGHVDDFLLGDKMVLKLPA